MRFSHRRRLLLASLLGLGLSSAISSPIDALAKQSTHTRTHTATVATLFRLQVGGRPAPGTTFWVSYGPLQDQWGVIRLLSRGGGIYSAWASLPSGRTSFAYLAAQGTVQTKAGPAPGGVPITIKLMGPTTTSTVAHTTVHWQASRG